MLWPVACVALAAPKTVRLACESIGESRRVSLIPSNDASSLIRRAALCLSFFPKARRTPSKNMRRLAPLARNVAARRLQQQTKANARALSTFVQMSGFSRYSAREDAEAFIASQQARGTSCHVLKQMPY